MDRIKHEFKTNLHSTECGSTVSVHRNLSGTRSCESNYYSKRTNNRKHHHNNKYLRTIKALCLSALSAVVTVPAHAADVGGVSATANPVANSSGSVTNQAIQVLQGPYITNTYGDGISCQGPTMNVTPYVTGSLSQQRPYEPYFNDPVYDMRDLDEDGSLDNPGGILYYVPTRTGQKDNRNLSIGFSATLSVPMNKKQQKLCEEAVITHNEYRAQLLANKRLDFEIARLKNCGQLKREGISFHPKSPYYAVCADVMVNNVTHVKDHVHSIPPISSSAEQSVVPSPPDSAVAAPQPAPPAIVPGSSFPVNSQSSSAPSSQSVSQPLTVDQQEALRAVRKMSLPQRYSR